MKISYTLNIFFILSVYSCIIRSVLCLNEVCLREDRYVLKQVVVLSRHSLRSPLSKNLTNFTTKKWPSWSVKPGYLTEKGRILEGYMGKYFADWLWINKLVTDGCPINDFYIYADKQQRTLASASAFATNAYPQCNLSIHHTDMERDPIFYSMIHNTSQIFQRKAIEKMQTCLKKLNLTSSYEYLENILDFKNSDICNKEHKCDLLTDNNTFSVIPGYKPSAVGPIKIGNSVIDAFIMQYYEGFPNNNVAWGRINDFKDWVKITEIRKGYHNVLFNNTLIANDMSTPLIRYIKQIFSGTFKATLLMGHDTNLLTLLKALQFKQYKLSEQFEFTPISGKLVFQKWYDNIKNVDLLKVEYVYQSTEQLRDSIPLILQKPPQSHTMVLEDCQIDDAGFCLWADFEKILKKF